MTNLLTEDTEITCDDAARVKRHTRRGSFLGNAFDEWQNMVRHQPDHPVGQVVLVSDWHSSKGQGLTLRSARRTSLSPVTTLPSTSLAIRSRTRGSRSPASSRAAAPGEEPRHAIDHAAEEALARGRCAGRCSGGPGKGTAKGPKETLRLWYRCLHGAYVSYLS